MKDNRPKFILNTITGWDEPPRSRHQVAKELRNYGDVYFITKNIKGKKKFEILRQDGITYIIPSWPLDYKLRYRLPLVNELYQKFIISIISKLKLSEGTIITFDHTAHLLVKKFKRAVYYCTDDHIGNSNVKIGLVDKYHSFTEKKISKLVDMCIASSDYLYQKLLKYNNNTHLILLGAPDVPPQAMYVKQEATGKIKVCYVGFMVPRKADKQIIKHIIDTDEFLFTAVGDVDKEYKELLGDKAVVTGVKKGNELYNIIQQSDICIIPYEVSSINKGVTPNKYWLYLSLGKPVVSVSIPNITSWPTNNGLLYLANSENFTSVIRKAYSEDSPEKFYTRISYAKENSWAVRIKQFIDLLLVLK